MTFNAHNPTAKDRRSAFTLVEVLVAFTLLAIISAVVLPGMRVASMAGEVGQRKMVAARIGNKVLNELKVTSQLQNTGQTGAVQDHGVNYRWAIKNQAWTEDSASQMIVATITVSFPAQGKDYEVHLSTLVAPPQQLATTSAAIY